MKRKFLLCVDNEGYKASLEVRKLYETIPDEEAERHNQVRVIDESGEDYLYPSKFFTPVRLSMQTKNRIIEKATSPSGRWAVPLLKEKAVTPDFTEKQGQYIAFVYNYSKINGRPPAEADIQIYFKVSPPTVHQMILKLEEKGFN